MNRMVVAALVAAALVIGGYVYATGEGGFMAGPGEVPPEAGMPEGDGGTVEGPVPDSAPQTPEAPERSPAEQVVDEMMKKGAGD